MTSLLMMLSVLVVGALFGVLIVGLFLAVKSLQSIRHWLEKTTVGLRSVEHQTRRLATQGDVLAASLRETLAALPASTDPAHRRRPLGARWRT